MITAEELRAAVLYEPETGAFKIARTSRGNRIGAPMGYRMSNGYRTLTVNQKKIYEHRAAFLWMTGSYPVGEIDHINHVRHDNRWQNLRDVTHKQNCSTVIQARKRPENAHMPTGVHLTNGRFSARIRIDGRKAHLGMFNTIEEAAEAYRVAADRRA